MARKLRGFERVLDAPALFAVAYGEIASSLYIALGIVAAQALGLSKTAAYELIRTGGWPTPVFRLGKLIRIPTAPLLTLLGIGAEPHTDERKAAAV